MPYNQYPDELRRQECNDWALVRNVSKLIRDLENVNFSLQSERTRGITLLNSLPREDFIFDQNNRFPDNCYVNVDEGDFPNVWAQILTALSYKSPDVANTNKSLTDNATNFQSSFTKNGKEKGNDQSDDKGNTNITNMNERDRLEKSLLSFQSGLMTMKKIKSQHALGRNLFEKRWNITFT